MWKSSYFESKRRLYHACDKRIINHSRLPLILIDKMIIPTIFIFSVYHCLFFCIIT